MVRGYSLQKKPRALHLLALPSFVGATSTRETGNLKKMLQLQRKEQLVCLLVISLVKKTLLSLQDKTCSTGHFLFFFLLVRLCPARSNRTFQDGLTGTICWRVDSLVVYFPESIFVGKRSIVGDTLLLQKRMGGPGWIISRAIQALNLGITREQRMTLAGFGFVSR